ncbi:MAG: response regulator [Proteobacteria bacterium]|nr:response regulator [Pseudomonadota bacterium]MBU1714790.1 response regulator [Pseudomonadota bacterium]
MFDPASITILIVDDDVFFSQEITRHIIENQGYKTICAASGEECIRKTLSSKPDLILLDINLPEINGIEVCKKLRSEENLKDLPIIFVTGNTEDETLQAAFEAGGTDYISKPINRIEILARVKNALSQKIMQQNLLEKEKLTSVLELAGAVCHELNQPLHAISGYSELLLLDVDESHPRYKAIKTINDQALRMGEITAKLMKITRYETRKYLSNTNIIDIDKSCADD